MSSLSERDIFHLIYTQTGESVPAVTFKIEELYNINLSESDKILIKNVVRRYQKKKKISQEKRIKLSEDFLGRSDEVIVNLREGLFLPTTLLCNATGDCNFNKFFHSYHRYANSVKKIWSPQIVLYRPNYWLCRKNHKKAFLVQAIRHLVLKFQPHTTQGSKTRQGSKIAGEK